jgi:hypothetical protein
LHLSTGPMIGFPHTEQVKGSSLIPCLVQAKFIGMCLRARPGTAPAFVALQFIASTADCAIVQIVHVEHKERRVRPVPASAVLACVCCRESTPAAPREQIPGTAVLVCSAHGHQSRPMAQAKACLHGCRGPALITGAVPDVSVWSSNCESRSCGGVSVPEGQSFQQFWNATFRPEVPHVVGRINDVAEPGRVSVIPRS